MHLLNASLISLQVADDFSPPRTSVGRLKFFSVSHVMVLDEAANNSVVVRELSSQIVCATFGSRSKPPGGR
jgi:hypothetical protein